MPAGQATSEGTRAMISDGIRGPRRRGRNYDPGAQNFHSATTPPHQLRITASAISSHTGAIQLTTVITESDSRLCGRSSPRKWGRFGAVTPDRVGEVDRGPGLRGCSACKGLGGAGSLRP